MNGNHLHLCNLVTLALVGGHETSRPCGSIFDKGSCKGNTAFVCITDCVGCSGIGHAAYIVDALAKSVYLVFPRHNGAVFCSHRFNADSLVSCGGVTVITPEESADFQLLLRFCKSMNSVGINPYDFRRTEFLFKYIIELFKSERFKRNASAVSVLADENGKSADLISCGDDASVLKKNEN